MAYVTLPGAIANGDMSTMQYLAVKLTGSTSVDFEIGVCTAATDKAIGILQDNPNTSGNPAEIAISGVCKAFYGGTVAQGDSVGTDASGRMVTRAETSTGGTTAGNFVLALALQNGVSTGIYTVLLVTPHLTSTAL